MITYLKSCAKIPYTNNMEMHWETQQKKNSVQSCKYTNRPIQQSRMREYPVKLFRCKSYFWALHRNCTKHRLRQMKTESVFSMLGASHDFTSVPLDICRLDPPRNVTGRTLHHPVTHVASSITAMEAEAPRSEELTQPNTSTLRYHPNASFFACPTVPSTVHSKCS